MLACIMERGEGNDGARQSFTVRQDSAENVSLSKEDKKDTF